MAKLKKSFAIDEETFRIIKEQSKKENRTYSSFVNNLILKTFGSRKEDKK